MLVGESLVISNDIPAQMHTLLHGANESTQVKICGLRTIDHIQAAINAGADLLGFIFYEPSSRYIPPEQAQTLRKPIAEQQTNVDIVGVFVNKTADYINYTVEQVGLNFVQLHGNESPEFCQAINCPVIKGLHLGSLNETSKIAAYKEATWRILLDTPTPKWGGTGETHDWNLARTIAQEMPILLAGGLTPENVAHAIAHVHPWGVDVSSGVETNGHKDVKKMQTFIKNVRTTERGRH
jgi:phosphoribosylanthranilate isomerase